MISKIRFVLFVLLAACAANPAAAEDAIIVGATCSALGTSTMATDQQNIVACLKNKSGALVWKSMSGDNTPAGTIAFFALAACPENWIMANGANNTIDLRGEFLRAWDGGRGLDAGRQLGTSQGDAIRNITGYFGQREEYANISVGQKFGEVMTAFGGAFGAKWGLNESIADGGDHGIYPAPYQYTFDASLIVPTANENRPHNVALLACQKSF